MFGHKKEITQKFIEKANDERENPEEKDEPKKEKIENRLDSKDSDNFIFYGENSKFSKQLEIYATLKDSQEKIQKDKLVLTVIDSSASIEYLSMKICENFSQFPEYQNLEGLRAINLTKINDEKNLPPEEKVENVLRNGDIIYLDLISNEIWIKVIFNMTSVINKNSKLIVSMDVKIKNEITFRQLRYKLMKSGIICFLDKCNKSDNLFHYVISELNISTSVHGNIDDKKLRSIDEMTIKQLFNFKSSMKLEIKFFPLEFILFQKLKILSIPKALNKKSMLWEKFKQLRFRELLNNKKYQKEKKYIFDFFKNLFKTKDSLPKCYIYSLEEDLNANTTENNIEKVSENIINNSETGGLEESENIKMNQSNNIFNKSLFNWSEMGKSSLENINISSIGDDLEKIALIILPPKQEEKNEIVPNPNPKKSKKSRSKNRKSTDRNYKLNFSDLEFGIISEENDEDASDDKTLKEGNKRKISDYNYTDKNTFKSEKKLSFEFLDKDNDMDDNNIYINLKPKNSNKKGKKHSAIKRNLCDDFEKFFEKEKFLDFLTGLYLIFIEKGVLEKSTIPEFRKLKIDEKKINSLNKRRKKKKLVDYSAIYESIFSVKRLNIELGVFSIFILIFLIIFSYLLSNTYY
jgi:hypothetical protein